MTLRAALIGCGWIGSEVADDPKADGVQSHAGAYAVCADTELVGVCDADPERAARAAQRWGVKFSFSEVGELLRAARPEIVSVCTPDASHAGVLHQVLGGPHTRAVIAEKPLAVDEEEARGIVKLARARGITLVVNYIRRFAPGHIEAQNLIASGALGAVVAVQGTYTKGIIHNGSHWFDLARWLIGDIVRVQAWPRADDSPNGDPTCHARIVFGGGQSGLLLGLDERNYTVFEIDVLGSAGRLRITDSGMRMEWLDVAPSPHFSGYRSLRPASIKTAGFRDAALRLVENTVAAVRDGSQVRCTGEDGIAALAVSVAAHRSLLQGSEITIT